MSDERNRSRGGLKALKQEMQELFWNRGSMSWSDVYDTDEYLRIKRAIDQREAELAREREARGFVLPDLSRDTAVSHMLRYVWRKGTVSSSDFSRTHELYRTKGESARQHYGRHMQFKRFLGHLMERNWNDEHTKSYYRWIGPKTREEWVSKMDPRTADRWFQELESRLTVSAEDVARWKSDPERSGSCPEPLTDDEREWLDALRKR